MAKTERHSVKAPLAAHPRPRLDDGSINPEMLEMLHYRYYSMAMKSLETWTDEEGNRLVDPVTIIAIDDRFMYLDQIAQVVDGIRGLTWFTTFNASPYKAALRQAIKVAGEAWATARHVDDYDRVNLRVTPNAVERLEQRPAS